MNEFVVPTKKTVEEKSKREEEHQLMEMQKRYQPNTMSMALSNLPAHISGLQYRICKKVWRS